MKQLNKFLLEDGSCPFDVRFDKIKDVRAKQRITARLARLISGNPGDHKMIGENLHELRIDVGKGWRVYYTEQNDEIVLLMLVGDKTQQSKDIAQVKEWLK